MRDDPAVVELVRRAAAGDPAAWDAIVQRYAPLVWSICQRYQLNRQDADDVGQSVWLRLVENVGGLRQPAALPGWLATTTRHECDRVLRSHQRHGHADLPGPDQLPAAADEVLIEELVLRDERNAALRTAFDELPDRHRDLLSMMIDDPPCSYQEISSKLGVPVGTIGSLRARSLKRLRQSPHVRAVVDRRAQERGDDTGEGDHHA